MNWHNRLKHLGRPDGIWEENSLLTPEQVKILEDQIRKNKERIDQQVALLDRLVNIEHYRKNHPKVMVIRSHMQLLMEENNTFRKTLWSHWLYSNSVQVSY